MSRAPETAVTDSSESFASRAGSRLERLFPLLALALFAVALAILHHELAAYSYHDLTRAIHGLARSQVVWAIALTVLAYAVLPG